MKKSQRNQNNKFSRLKKKLLEKSTIFYEKENIIKIIEEELYLKYQIEKNTRLEHNQIKYM